MTLYLGVVEYVADVADVVAVVRRDVDADGNAWLGDWVEMSAVRRHARPASEWHPNQCLFQKNLQSPNGYQIVCYKALSFFSAGTMNYKYIMETFF